jgi:hypothetical protein
MNRTHIKNSKIVVIRQDLNIAKSFSVKLNIPFPVSEIIVKQIAYNADIAENGVYEIWTELARDGVITAFIEGSSSSPAIFFSPKQVDQPIDGDFNFKVLEALAPQALSAGTIGNLAVVLEFVEYAK